MRVKRGCALRKTRPLFGSPAWTTRWWDLKIIACFGRASEDEMKLLLPIIGNFAKAARAGVVPGA